MPAMPGNSKSERKFKKRKADDDVDAVVKANELRHRRQAKALRRISSGTTSAEAAGLDASFIESFKANHTARRARKPGPRADYAERAFTSSLDYPSAGKRDELRLKFQVGETIGLERPEIVAKLPDAQRCCHCLAFRFYHESACFCCAKGAVKLVNPPMPQLLADLFTKNDAEYIAFRRFARTYNNNLAFTSFSARKDDELLKNTFGVYTFKAQGRVHHFLNSLNPKAGIPTQPSGIQLYFYDPDTELEARLNADDRFTRQTMAKLTRALAKNPYAKFLRQLRTLPDVDEWKIYLINNPKLDQRTFNQPTVADVSGIIHVDDEV